MEKSYKVKVTKHFKPFTHPYSLLSVILNMVLIYGLNKVAIIIFDAGF